MLQQKFPSESDAEFIYLPMYINGLYLAVFTVLVIIYFFWVIVHFWLGPTDARCYQMAPIGSDVQMY